MPARFPGDKKKDRRKKRGLTINEKDMANARKAFRGKFRTTDWRRGPKE